MKTLRMFFSVGALVALLGLNVALADIKSESAGQETKFDLDAGDGGNLSPLSFDTAGNNEAQTTCATTPGGPSVSQLLEAPVVSPPDTEQLTQLGDLSPVSSQNLATGTPPTVQRPPRYPLNNNPTGGGGGDGEEEDPQPPATPEPATLLLVGLGIGGAAMVARRRLNKSGR